MRVLIAKLLSAARGSLLPVLFGTAFGMVLHAAPVMAQDALLDEARAQMAAGNPGGAYAMLAAQEEERLGNPAFDYLLGVAALDAGRLTNAVFALERVVAVQPDNTLARAELARAYAQLREFESARNQLQVVREGQVPDDARERVERYLGAVETAIGQQFTQMRGYIGASYGYDSNVNASTDDSQIALPLFGGALVSLNNNAIGRGDQFSQFMAGAGVRHAIRPDLALNAGFDVNSRLVDDLDQFDTASFAGFAGLDYRRNDYVYSVALQGEHFRLDSDAYRNAVGVLGQVRRPLGPAAQVTGYVQATRIDYPSQSIRDADRYTLGAAYSQALQAAYAPVVFAGVYVGTEDERRSGVPHLGHDFYGARAGVSLDATRDWTVTPALEYTRNDSDVAINDYDRSVVSVSIRRDFR